jgi:NH3-dependent NAD+ synthetase
VTSKESEVMAKKKVIIGLSGGVDSSVAAYLLLKDGYDVEAVFMRNWDSATNLDIKGNPTAFDEVCEQEKDYQDAKEVADKLGIILHKVDFIEDYWDRVFTYFLDEYKKIEPQILTCYVIMRSNSRRLSIMQKDLIPTISPWAIMLKWIFQVNIQDF